jgi:O-antigen/teichoic acid export membrane protein
MGWSRVLLVKTLPFTVLALCGWVLAISDRWMLSFFGSVAETGRYAAFYQACSVTAALSTGFAATIVQPVIFQKIARGESAGHVMTVALNVALVLTAPPLIALAWIPDFFLPIVISHKYGLPSPWLVVGVAVGAFLLGLESVVSMGVVAATSAWRIVRYAVAAATTNVLLNSLFIPRFGAVAAGVSTGIAYGIEAILVLLAARAVCGLRLPLASIVAAIVFAMAGAAAIGLAGFGLHTRVIFASAGVLCWALVSRESLANCVSGLKYFVFSRPSVLT